MDEGAPNSKRKLSHDEDAGENSKKSKPDDTGEPSTSNRCQRGTCTQRKRSSGSGLIITVIEKSEGRDLETSSDENEVEITENLAGSNLRSLAELPTCVLLHLLGFLDATSLYQLSRTCELFRDLVLDRSLWRYIDGRYLPNKRRKVRYLQNRIYNKTTDLRLAGANQAHMISNYKFFKNETFNLSVLALENQYLDALKHSLASYPKTLEELSLRGTFVQHAKCGFMKNIAKSLIKLRVLILDDCQWLSSEVFMSLSKLPNLEILSLYKCKQRTSADICYLSIAGTLGFEKLKVMNCRHTAVADETLKVMYKHPKIQEMYFQCYERTYALEKAQRELDILTGKDKVLPHSYLNEEYFINDTNKRFMTKYFGNGKFSVKSTNTLGDGATHWFLNVVSGPMERGYMPTKLYKPQYEACTCGFQEKFWNNQTIIKENNDFEGVEDPKNKEGITDFEQKLCRPPCYYFKYIGLLSKKAEIDNVIVWLKRKIRRDLYRIKRGHARRIYMVRPEVDEINFDKCSRENVNYIINSPATRDNKKRHFLFTRDPVNLYEIEMLNHAAKDLSYLDISLYRWTSQDHDYHQHRNVFRVNSNVNIVRPTFNFNSGLTNASGESSQGSVKASNMSTSSTTTQESSSTEPKVNYPYYKAGSENDDSYTELSSENDDNSNDSKAPPKKKMRLRKDACDFKKKDCNNDFPDKNSKNNRKSKGRIRRLSYSDSSCPSGDDGDEVNPNVREKTRQAMRLIRQKGDTGHKAKCSHNDEGQGGSSSTPKKDSGSKKHADDDSDSDLDDFLELNHCTKPQSKIYLFARKPSTKSVGTSTDDSRQNSQSSREEPTRTYSRISGSSIMIDVHPPPDVHVNVDQPQQLGAQPRHRSRNRPVMRDVFHDVIYINIHENDNGNLVIGPAPVPEKPKIQLKILSLRGFSDITDRTLHHLENLELELLDVTYTGVSPEGVRNYLLKHPNTRVLHETACICRPRMEF